MTSESIIAFIAHARSKNMDHQTIRMLLLSAGWKEKDVSQALATETLDMPVPLPPDAGSARDAFFHLLSFTSLISTVGSLIFLIFDFLNRWLPDPAVDYYSTNDVSGIRWGLAVLFVSFPLYLWMMRLIHREMSLHGEKLGSGVRRWLTYFILFITACTLVGDLITVLSSLLNGELTIRFLLKVVTIFVLCGLPFLYYFHALRLDSSKYSRSPAHAIFFWLSTLIVIATIVVGFLIAGGPSFGRQERFDDVRLNDLRAIQNEVLNIVYGGKRYTEPSPTALPNPLPKTLDAIANSATYQRVHTTDPETSEPYTYRITSNHNFQLCATFSLPLDQDYDVFWNHPAGNHCYSFDALDPQGK